MLFRSFVLRKGPVGVAQDEQPGKSDASKIPGLKPAFGKDGTITAASSASISDGAAALVLARAKQAQSADAFDLVASLFPDTPEADEARATAGRLREAVVLDSAGPTYQGRDLVQRIQEQLARLDCMTGEGDGAFEAATIEGLRRASQLSDERYLWYRPTMAALRALKKIDVNDGCGRRKVVAAPRCLRVNNEDFCR